MAKARLLANDAHYMQLQDYDVYRELAPVLGALPTAGFFLVPGIAGIIALAGAKRRPLARRVAVLAGVFALSFLPFFVVGRYRAPWLFLLAPFAAFASLEMVRLTRSVRGRAWNNAVVVTTAAAA